eukprot:CAMPEP_0180809626 /NCGR_PEP_ID=MMETSP1038_2-20121128/64423_1 /TAXON_ID=632150 /ORGANISM="Azadinium spinosum, Strain 3D9" /LENGTH=61 /DNA_ID=CAMNT_0022850805 /DNA_START=76 /DNA_END=258 /DNA_ORIENTATION=+
MTYLQALVDQIRICYEGTRPISPAEAARALTQISRKTTRCWKCLAMALALQVSGTSDSSLR